MFDYKKKKREKVFNILFKIFFSLFVFLIPWQTRFIVYSWPLGEETWQYGQLSLYLSALILFLSGLFFVLSNKEEKKFSKSKFLYFLFLYSVVTSLLSPAPPVSLYYLFLIYSAALFAYLVKFLPKFFVFRTLMLSGLVQGILAICQLMTQRVVANKWLGMSEHLPSVLGTSVVEFGDQRILRAYGSLPHPNILGGFLFVVIFIGIYLWVDIYKREYTGFFHKFFKQRHFLDFVFIIVGVTISTFGLLATFSRSALLALGLSLFSVALINILKRQYLFFGIVVKYSVIFLLVFLTFNTWFPGAWSARWNMEGRLEQQSVNQRVDTISQLGWDDYKTGFFGQGLGMNTFDAYHQYKPDTTYDVQPIHDIFLLLLAEVGIVGAFLLFNIVRMIVKSANKVDIMSTSLILGLAIIGLFDHYLWTSWTGWLLVSLGLVNLYKHKKT